MDEVAPLATRRVAFLVEYEGTEYSGLQWQSTTQNTIQQKIEEAAHTLGSLDGNFVAAGRTDAGVHALGQVVAIDLPERLPLKRVCRSMNALLPPDIRVRKAALPEEGFSPRFDAVGRTYIYRLCSREPVPPILRRFVAFTPARLDAELTSAATAAFEGQWELREWRSSMCQGTRTFLNIDIARSIPPSVPDEDYSREPCPYWRFQFSARSFLHHQVRFMVGGIIAVGSGRISLQELQDSLAAGLRPNQVKCEEACGLVLTRVDYPSEKDPFHQEEVL